MLPHPLNVALVIPLCLPPQVPLFFLAGFATCFPTCTSTKDTTCLHRASITSDRKRVNMWAAQTSRQLHRRLLRFTAIESRAERQPSCLALGFVIPFVRAHDAWHWELGPLERLGAGAQSPKWRCVQRIHVTGLITRNPQTAKHGIDHSIGK
jgi:hypothetical protein